MKTFLFIASVFSFIITITSFVYLWVLYKDWLIVSSFVCFANTISIISFYVTEKEKSND